MKPENLNKNLTETEIDGLIRSYGRVPTQKLSVAIITQIMNTTVEDFERNSQAQAEESSEQIDQAEDAQLEEEQDGDFQ